MEKLINAVPEWIINRAWNDTYNQIRLEEKRLAENPESRIAPKHLEKLYKEIHIRYTSNVRRGN